MRERVNEAHLAASGVDCAAGWAQLNSPKDPKGEKGEVKSQFICLSLTYKIIL